MTRRILVVEDEPGLLLTLGDRLRREGYEVETEDDGDAGLERAATGGYDLIVLDVMLPHRTGFDICRDLRQRGVFVPVLMLTARRQTADKVVGLKLGADDYLTKPFKMMELLARIEALLRRAFGQPAAPQSVCEFGSVRVDLRRAEVFRDGKPVSLSAREFQLLRYFVEHRGEVLPREKLLQEVWGYETLPLTRTVDVHVTWLRQKLEPNPKEPQLIRTVYGLGYRFSD
jgi:two-component system alkaline phosphatase synthesis response regulator PhoP